MDSSVYKLPRAAARAKFDRKLGSKSRCRTGFGQPEKETTNLSCSTTFRRKTGRLSASGLVLYRMERRHRGLRILPQEGARSTEQAYSHKASRSLIQGSTDKRYFYPESSKGK